MVNRRQTSRMHAAAMFAILVLAAFTAPVLADDATPAAYDLQQHIAIPMRDGVALNANVFKPHAISGTLPVLFCLNPYTADVVQTVGAYFARHGYVFVSVDSRGRGGSQGVFRSWLDEGKDGYDTAEWLAKQPWSNGDVGMWGGSYLGFTEWATLKEKPPHLRTIVPTSSVRPGLDFPLSGGIFYSYAAQWLTYVGGVALNTKQFTDSAFWREKFGERYFDNAPFRELDRITGTPSPNFQDYLRHPDYDDYWRSLAPSPAEYAAIDVPILTIAGDYDDDQIGALSYYREHMRDGSAKARAEHYLVIGPWDHFGTRRPQKQVGGLTFGDASLIDILGLHLAWYDWVFKHGKKPDFLKQRVAYYVAGDEAWKYADAIDAIATPLKLFLSSQDGRANDVFHSGSLSKAAPANEAADSYTYDPRDTKPGKAEIARGDTDSSALVDQSDAYNLDGAGVVYTGNPLPEAIEFSGAPTAELWLTLDAPDTDFSATLYEIKTDGSAVRLSSMLLRARYRDSLSEAKPVPLGVPQKVRFDRFNFVSRKLAQGSRLRFVFGAVNGIQFEKNYNSGGVVADETAANARSVHVRVLHDVKHPSALELPFVATTTAR